MMNRALFVLLAICTLTAAMVPRHRREINKDEENPPEKSSEICARETQCAWSFYKPSVKIVDQHVKNSYCDCAPGMTCQQSHEDPNINAFVYHCKTSEAPKS